MFLFVFIIFILVKSLGPATLDTSPIGMGELGKESFASNVHSGNSLPQTVTATKPLINPSQNNINI